MNPSNYVKQLIVGVNERRTIWAVQNKINILVVESFLKQICASDIWAPGDNSLFY